MKLMTASYIVMSRKLPRSFHGYRMAVLADLHNTSQGERREQLIQALRDAQVNTVLIAGDMVTEKGGEHSFVNYQEAEDFLLAVAAEWPVYYENGNHEGRWKLHQPLHPELYEDYKNKLEAGGISFLENTSVFMKNSAGEKIRITGLELPDPFFRRGKIPKLTEEDIQGFVGPADEEYFQILLAHCPQFFDAYMDWGADLVLSGHFHGGMVRLPFLGGVISTYLHLFPKYDHGEFRRDSQHMIVSSGLGMHTLPLRINNPEELVVIELRREEKGTEK